MSMREAKRYAIRLTSRMEPNRLFGDGGSGTRAGETTGGTVLSSSFGSVVGCGLVRSVEWAGKEKVDSLGGQARLWVMVGARPAKVGE